MGSICSGSWTIRSILSKYRLVLEQIVRYKNLDFTIVQTGHCSILVKNKLNEFCKGFVG